ncbi:hypothetical protein BDR06DRAFT_716324 [Suillus hirtellus]|nr:hypothetical protein BDR06DRAFT_716324 [Suillus hirtellus]
MCRIPVISATHSASDSITGLFNVKFPSPHRPFATHIYFAIISVFICYLRLSWSSQLTAESLQGLAGMSRGRQALLSLTLIQIGKILCET